MKNSKKYTLIIASIITLLIFSINSKIVVNSIKYSLTLCYDSVIPALFPFFVLSEFFVSLLACTRLNPTVYLFICGLLTGFPNGTKAVCKLYQNNTIERKTAVKLLYCTANASPAYIVSFIGLCVLKSRTIGIIVFLAQIITSVLCAISFKTFTNKKTYNINTISVTETACNSITGSVSGCLNVCGYIIFSGVLADIAIAYNIPEIVSKILFFLPSKYLNIIIVGFIEITRGISLLGDKNISSIILISIIVGFSGLSVILQCISCAVKNGLPYKPIILGKIIYSVLMPIITFCLLKIIPIRYQQPHNPLSSLILIIFIVFLAIFLYIFFDKSYKRLYNK